MKSLNLSQLTKLGLVRCVRISFKQTLTN
jgi:hypothetical protein